MPRVEEKEQECSLLAATRKALLKCDKTDLEIYRDTGLHPGWLRLLRAGLVNDPSVNRVQKLYEYLHATPLAVAH